MAGKRAHAGVEPAPLLPLSNEELAALRADVKANGVLHPVFVDPDGNVLDGRHRLSIDKSAPKKVIRGLFPEREFQSGTEREVFTVACNFRRRNISADQKKELKRWMKKAAAQLRAEDPKFWTQKRVAQALGVDRSAVAKWFEKTGRTNVKRHNSSNTTPPLPEPTPVPDARVTVPPAAKPDIFRRVESGESQAQVASDFGVSQRQISNIVRAEQKKREEAEKAAAEAESAKRTPDNGIIVADFREAAKSLDDESVALIFTDPPYDRTSLPLYGHLAEVAARVLKPGGSLVCYLGQFQIGEVIGIVSPHLRLWWTLACIHTGGSSRMKEYGIIVKWKPMLWFVKGTRRDKNTWIEDAVESERQKTTHRWQQGLPEAEYYIDRLTLPGELVFDPFCGGGTTAVAAFRQGRRWFTCDTDKASANKARKRLAGEMEGGTT